MRFWGYSLEGTYESKDKFFFSLVPAFGIEREGDFWCFQLIFMNMTLAVFTGVENGEG